MYMFICMCICACACACVHMCMCACVYVYAYAHVYVCVCVCVCTFEILIQCSLVLEKWSYHIAPVHIQLIALMGGGGGITHLVPDSMGTMCNPQYFQSRSPPPTVSTFILTDIQQKTV